MILLLLVGLPVLVVVFLSIVFDIEERLTDACAQIALGEKK